MRNTEIAKRLEEIGEGMLQIIEDTNEDVYTVYDKERERNVLELRLTVEGAHNCREKPIKTCKSV